MPRPYAIFDCTMVPRHPRTGPRAPLFPRYRSGNPNGRLRASRKGIATLSNARSSAIAITRAAPCGIDRPMPLDPQMLAIGLAALAGGALALAGLLVARNRSLAHELSALRTRAEELDDRNWELRESQD